ncbi:MAG: hypothetical protein WB662_17540 [Methyloceanibacter sp.]
MTETCGNCGDLHRIDYYGKQLDGCFLQLLGEPGGNSLWQALPEAYPRPSSVGKRLMRARRDV